MLFSRLQLALAGVVVAALLVITLIQTIQLHGFLWIPGALDKLEDCAKDRNELRALAEETKQAQAETQRQLEQARKDRAIVNGKAERIERAELPGDCKTSPEIMGADL